MFDRSDLEALAPALLVDWRYMGCYPGLHFTVFPQHAFRVPDAEQTLRITRAPKRPGDTGLQFWVSAENANSLPGAQDPATKTRRAAHAARAFNSTRFLSIDEAQFNGIVHGHCAELLVAPALPLHPPRGFIGALSMHAPEDELTTSVFAEYTDEFIHFHWDSTA